MTLKKSEIVLSIIWDDEEYDSPLDWDWVELLDVDTEVIAYDYIGEV